MKKVLIIIPSFNEEENILKTCNKITNLKLKDYDINYIIINDGSTDLTKNICIENGLNFVNLVSNLGIGGAVQTGYKYAFYNNYDFAIQFDGDGQHNENYILNLLEEIEKDDVDLVIGSRFVTNLSKFKSTKFRRVGIKFLSSLMHICVGKKIKDPTSGFRAANKKVIKLFASEYPTDYPEPETIITLIKKSYKVKEIPVEMNERLGGESSIKKFKILYYMFKVSLAILIASISVKGEK